MVKVGNHSEEDPFRVATSCNGRERQSSEHDQTLRSFLSWLLNAFIAITVLSIGIELLHHVAIFYGARNSKAETSMLTD